LAWKIKCWLKSNGLTTIQNMGHGLMGAKRSILWTKFFLLTTMAYSCTWTFYPRFFHDITIFKTFWFTQILTLVFLCVTMKYLNICWGIKGAWVRKCT
jgi:hypothetical protein